MKELVLIKNPPRESRAALILLKKDLIKKSVYYGYQGWLRFRFETLTNILKDRGILQCNYCNKGPLLIETDNKDPYVATLDHKNPLSRGGAKFDLTNLVVCCISCNQKKGNKILTF